MNALKPADDEGPYPPSRGSLVVTNKSLALPVISLKGIVSAPSAALNKFHDVTDSLSLSPTTLLNLASLLIMCAVVAYEMIFFFNSTDDSLPYEWSVAVVFVLAVYTVGQICALQSDTYKTSKISPRLVIIWFYLLGSFALDVAGVFSSGKAFAYDWTTGNWDFLLGGIASSVVAAIAYGLYVNASDSKGKDILKITAGENVRRGSFRKAMGLVMVVSLTLLLWNIYRGFVPHLDESRAGYALFCLILSSAGFFAIFYVFDDAVEIEKDRGIKISEALQR